MLYLSLLAHSEIKKRSFKRSISPTINFTQNSIYNVSRKANLQNLQNLQVDTTLQWMIAPLDFLNAPLLLHAHNLLYIPPMFIPFSGNNQCISRLLRKNLLAARQFWRIVIKVNDAK